MTPEQGPEADYTVNGSVVDQCFERYKHTPGQAVDSFFKMHTVNHFVKYLLVRYDKVTI